MIRTHIGRTVAGAAAVAGTLVACRPAMHPELRQARAAYEETAREPELADDAPVQLHEAEQALAEAERDWEDDGSVDEARHDAYVVRRRLEIARATAQEKVYERQTDAAAGSRQGIQLEARERELADLRARRTDRGLEITLGDVLFEFDRAQLKPGAARTLDRLVSVVREDPSTRVVIEGHTDAVGDDGYNRRLSADRAAAVRDYLVQHGIDGGRIVSRGYGEDYPVASNDTEAGRQQNRRVNVVIVDRGGTAADGPLSRRAP